MDAMAKRYITFIFVLGAVLATLSLPFSGFGQAPQIGSIDTNSINSAISGNETNAQITTIDNLVSTQTHATYINTTSTIYTTTVNTVVTTACGVNNGGYITDSKSCSSINSGFTTTITLTQTTTLGSSTTVTNNQQAINLPLQSCTGGNGFIGSVQNGICTIDVQIRNALVSTYCTLVRTAINTKPLIGNGLSGLGITYCNAQQQLLTQQIGAATVPTSPSIFDLTGGYQNGVHVVSSNNAIVTILGNPLTQAIVIAITFVALGLLAGTLGAGLLANIVSRVGLFLALYYYLNSEMAAFGSIPILVTLFINAILAVPAIILLYESLGQGKG